MNYLDLNEHLEDKIDAEDLEDRRPFYAGQRTPTGQLPTGAPTGPSPTPIPRGQVLPMAPPGEQAPQTVQSTMYTPGYLATQIGKTMRVEFLIGGSGPLVDRIGTLLSVGASYILLRPIGTQDVLLCDIYSIKFVTILSRPIV